MNPKQRTHHLYTLPLTMEPSGVVSLAAAATIATPGTSIPTARENFCQSRTVVAVPPGRLRKYFNRLLLAVIVLFIVYTFIGEAAVVPTGSMEGTILIGDHILLNKFLYGPAIPFTTWHLPRFRHVQRGNIVAFHYPLDPSLNFLKRVAAVGGDTVEIRDDILYVNQIPIREPYAVHTAKPWLRRPEQMKPLLVPAGTLFVLGDNRDNSDDSRYWGTVPVANVIGEPFMVFWSYDAPSRDWLEENPTRQLRFYASIVFNILGRTRWSRTGALL